jgi:hypothetical protein
MIISVKRALNIIPDTRQIYGNRQAINADGLHDESAYVVDRLGSTVAGGILSSRGYDTRGVLVKGERVLFLRGRLDAA